MSSETRHDADVLVIGNGPVGAVASILLAQQGHRVTVVERRPRPYRLPRATSFDGETARLLAATGIAGEMPGVTEPATGYQWRNRHGQVLLDIVFDTEAGTFGWPDANTMHQPSLEELLAARAAQLPGITLLRGAKVVGLTDGPDGVLVSAETSEGPVTLTAAWVIGCDGANSFVREQLEVPVTDLGFSYEWLLCDVEMLTPRDFVPTNVQICDPDRPTTVVASYPQPWIEVHLSNVWAREAFRHNSVISPLANGVIAGLGAAGYELAADALLRLIPVTD